MQPSNERLYDPEIVTRLADRRAAHAMGDAARPVPEDFGLTVEDLKISYSPGRAGSLLAIATTLVTAVYVGLDWWLWTNPWMSVLGVLYGSLLGGFAGLGILALIHWCDPLLGSFWPTYARLRRYREALATARKAEETAALGRSVTGCNRA